MRLALAATAPFGADVLERLAATEEIAYLLTRPDAPRGRGRRLAAPPAKESARRLGIPVHQPARPELPPEPVDAVVVCAYGLLIPDTLLAADPLAQRPSLAAAALARRRPGRARDPRRRRRDGRDDPRDGEGARRGADRGPGGVPARRRRRRRLGVRPLRRARRDAPRAGCCRQPSFRPQAGDATYADKIGPADRELDLDDPLDASRRVRALSPHIGALGDAARPPGDGLAGAARRGQVRAGRGAARGAPPDELRGVPPRGPSVSAGE